MAILDPIESEAEKRKELDRLREVLRVEIKAARSAQMVWEDSFSASLHAIHRFLKYEAFSDYEDAAECIEPDHGDGWAFSVLNTYWRHLGDKRRRPVVYLPLNTPKPNRGIEVVKMSEIPEGERPSGNEWDLVVKITLDQNDPSIEGARAFAEAEGLSDWIG